MRETLHVSPEAELLPHTREVSNVWTCAKDGKVYFRTGLPPKDLLK